MPEKTPGNNFHKRNFNNSTAPTDTGNITPKPLYKQKFLIIMKTFVNTNYKT